MRRRRGRVIKLARSVAYEGRSLDWPSEPRIVSGTINKEKEG
jgi:hypothetical protein